jgi:hypothetical protein
VLRIFKKTKNKITGKACGIIGIMAILNKVVTIVPLKTVFRAEPEKSLVVLNDRPDVPIG